MRRLRCRLVGNGHHDPDSLLWGGSIAADDLARIGFIECHAEEDTRVSSDVGFQQAFSTVAARPAAPKPATHTRRVTRTSYTRTRSLRRAAAG